MNKLLCGGTASKNIADKGEVEVKFWNEIVNATPRSSMCDCWIAKVDNGKWILNLISQSIRIIQIERPHFLLLLDYCYLGTNGKYIK